jgi:type IV pilus assembly protein PilE
MLPDGEYLSEASLSRSKSHSGFSLVELMVAVAIVGILASIAFPGYQSQMRKTRRADAQGVLLQNAAFLERYFTENNCYKDKGGDGICGSTDNNPTLPVTQSPPAGTKHYDIAIQSGDGTTFTLRATPAGGQTGDGILEYSNSGAKGWDKNGDGDTADAGENVW